MLMNLQINIKFGCEQRLYNYLLQMLLIMINNNGICLFVYFLYKHINFREWMIIVVTI